SLPLEQECESGPRVVLGPHDEERPPVARADRPTHLGFLHASRWPSGPRRARHRSGARTQLDHRAARSCAWRRGWEGGERRCPSLTLRASGWYNLRTPGRRLVLATTATPERLRRVLRSGRGAAW